jgi:hypothetical protein
VRLDAERSALLRGAGYNPHDVAEDVVDMTPEELRSRLAHGETFTGEPEGLTIYELGEVRNFVDEGEDE